jgi:hypothetical protein
MNFIFEFDGKKNNKNGSTKIADRKTLPDDQRHWVKRG